MMEHNLYAYSVWPTFIYMFVCMYSSKG